MYCSLGQNQFFDDAGAPLSAGRVKIYAKGSDTLLPIYEDNGDGFVPAQNPVITANDGRIPTVFWPAALVDVVVEKSNGDGTYTELDSYVAGLDLTPADSTLAVSSIAELRLTTPGENLVVDVDGYYEFGDSPSRKYIWVQGLANTDDGGYVIASGVDNSGRWIMLWEGHDELPASIYGVIPGGNGTAMTANIANLFAVGSSINLSSTLRIYTPDCIYFDTPVINRTNILNPGYYLEGAILTTTKRIRCSRDNLYLHGATPPEIHCSGVRGEKYAVANWRIDQSLNIYDDYPEKINTDMFDDNDYEHLVDDFITCANLSRVKYVEFLKSNSVSYMLGNKTIRGKIVIDCTEQPTLYINCNFDKCVYFKGLSGASLITYLKSEISEPRALNIPSFGISEHSRDSHKIYSSDTTSNLYLQGQVGGIEFHENAYHDNDTMIVSNTSSTGVLNVYFTAGSKTITPGHSGIFVKIDDNHWNVVE
jgi:hypothetical protein